MYLTNNTLLQGGKYKIVGHISSGGFGNTYEGVHTMMDTRVAIKEFFPKMFCNRDENTSHVTVATQGNRELVDKLRKKFNEEAKSVFQMKHDNIVRVLDIFEENGTAYYVMEYIDGKSLNEITKERGALPVAEALGYICQVADALKYVHSLNRLHLDIKPGNIMVDKNGKAILIDFGASKHYDDESGENTSTLMGVNTKGYAPIEQSTQSSTSFSPATDIYALGATLYKLLTGIVPPDANLLLAEEETLQPLSNSISAPTRNAVMAAMQLRRKDRPQSADEFLKLLDSKQSASQNKSRIYSPKDNGKAAENEEETFVDSETQFSKDVKELCELTGISMSGCEKALKQTKGNKRAALIMIQTNNLYKKYGCTELGIGRGTCKRYVEHFEGSLEKAEKGLSELLQERKNDVDTLYSEYKGILDDFDLITCQKIYTDANFDKENANDKLLEWSQHAKCNKRAALIMIQTNNLYKKYGCTELGIGRGTCKRYVEHFEGSLEKAEKGLSELLQERKNDVDTLYSEYKGILDDFDLKTCQKIYTDANFDKEKANDKLLEWSQHANSSQEDNDGCLSYLWKGLKNLFRFLMMYVISGIFFIPTMEVCGEDSVWTLIMGLIGFIAAIVW